MAEFPFKPGDLVRLREWADTDYVTVTSVGTRLFLATDPKDTESAYVKYTSLGPWEPYTPPPRRLIVENRHPEPGDRYIYGHMLRWPNSRDDSPGDMDRWTVVEELPR